MISMLSIIRIKFFLFKLDAAFLADHKNKSFKKKHRKIQKSINEIKNCIVLKIEKCTEFYFAQFM
jgi:hypothetical protein